MKFTVSSSALLSVLSMTGKVINNKSSLPILEHFLMELKDGVLRVTASDAETTLVGTLEVENIEREGMVAAPAKVLLDVLKECSEMPLTLDVNESTWEIKITWHSGSSSVPGANPVSYPTSKSLSDDKAEVTLDVDTLVNGINKSIFATADDDFKPMINGIYFNIDNAGITFVATDGHKLVKHTAKQESQNNASFILPKKPANLLKNLLLKEEDDVLVSFDKSNAVFTMKNYTLICRLIEGMYPNYNAVIPVANPNKILIDRIEFLNGIKRVAVCANSATNLIRLDIADNKMTLTAQDVNFYVSANQSLSCSYDGSPISIGFKSVFLIEILANIETPTVLVELADSTRAGVFKPVYDDEQTTSTLMLLMPMIISA
ncbi:MAG: DNA polymerase III subunit beta [Alistipes sp.]|jgi:DNA polymerase-3 subunit beta|nr:DNA polymerase III subunit beta [Alistipes sp.]MBQ5692165.1 DNA polymerase III subunit beta [Alistipes sp.]MBQ5855084.1 DNA polymerase III subunit beta [Alistipes sp.]